MTTKEYKGEKYIYLLMAWKLALENGGSVQIGHDNRFVGGYMYWRSFAVRQYEGKELLTEIKTSRAFADYSRTYEVISGSSTDDKPIIREYIDKDGNHSTGWIH